MNEHMMTEGKSAVKNKKELETLDTQRLLALLQLFPLDNKQYSLFPCMTARFEKNIVLVVRLVGSTNENHSLLI